MPNKPVIEIDIVMERDECDRRRFYQIFPKRDGSRIKLSVPASRSGAEVKYGVVITMRFGG